MKECFAITSYCNTEKKVQVLNRTLENLKQYELPIFIHAHYPLSFEIQKKVHSYFYSSDNPILDYRFNSFWYFVDNYKLEITVSDYYFTALKGWSETINILQNYDRIHIINYDTNLYPELFELTKKYTQSLFLKNVDPNKPLIQYIRPTYFRLNKKSYDYFRNNITLEKYLSFDKKNEQFLPLVEEFIPTFTTGDDFYHIPRNEYDDDRLLEYDIAADTRFDWVNTLSINDTKLFIGEIDNRVHLLFFDVQKPIKIDMFVFPKHNAMGGEIGKNITSTTIFSLDFPFNEIEKLIVKVNDVPVDNDLIQKFFQLKCKIFTV